MTKILRHLVLFIGMCVFVVATPTQAFAQGWNGNCVYNDDGDQVATLKGVECLFTRIINIAISLIGIALLVMIFLGGFKMLTSGGDPKGVEAGKNTLTYAILGLVVALSAWFILTLIANFTGANNDATGNILEFEVPQF